MVKAIIKTAKLNLKMHTETMTWTVSINDVELKAEPTLCEKHVHFVVIKVIS